jgi:hypothetical protein
MMEHEAYQSVAEKLIQYLDETVLIAKAQLPDIAVQMLAWGVQSNTIGLWVFGAASFVFIVFIALGFLSGEPELGTLMSSLGLALCLICTLASYTELKKIEAAPKLYILEEARDLVAKKE